MGKAHCTLDYISRNGIYQDWQEKQDEKENSPKVKFALKKMYTSIVVAAGVPSLHALWNTSNTCSKCFQEEDKKEALAIAMKHSMAEVVVSIGIS